MTIETLHTFQTREKIVTFGKWLSLVPTNPSLSPIFVNTTLLSFSLTFFNTLFTSPKSLITAFFCHFINSNAYIARSCLVFPANQFIYIIILIFIYIVMSSKHSELSTCQGPHWGSKRWRILHFFFTFHKNGKILHFFLHKNGKILQFFFTKMENFFTFSTFHKNGKIPPIISSQK